MIEKISSFWQTSDKYILIPILISVTCLFLVSTLYFAAYQLLPPRLPLFYSLPWGADQLVVKQQFLLLPTVIVLLTLINLAIASQLHPLQYVLKRTLMLSLILMNIAMLITVVRTLFIFV